MVVMRIYLKGSGVHAELHPDGLTPDGTVLSVGGAEQSHVHRDHPEEVFYAYLRRIAAVLDLLAPPGEPVAAAHLGGGALTLPRYLAATRPGSAQWVVEIERELPDFVLSHLPMPADQLPHLVLDDARAALPGLAAHGPFDTVVLDVFSGRDAPAHLTGPDFYAEAAALLGEDGTMLVNVGDDPGLGFFRTQVEAMGEVFGDLWCLTDTPMLTGRYPGNLVLLGARRVPDAWAEQLTAAGPHPASVLDRAALETWVNRLP